jgi:hypothetical protein
VQIARIKEISMLERMFLIRFAVLAFIATAAAWGADVTGKWSAQMNGPDGGGMTMTFNFKQDGAKLTGTIDGPGGEPMAIQEGKVDGEKIVFAVSFNDMKIVHEGTIKGDEITLTIQMSGGPHVSKAGARVKLATVGTSGLLIL